MTLHAAYTTGTMFDDIMRMSVEKPETWLRDLRHVDQEGDTALSLLLKVDASDFFVTVLLQMDKWALGVRCKRTGNFPVHVVYERKFSPQLRKIVAVDSFWIICGYNNDGNTVLHLALKSKCEASIVSLLRIMCNTALMLTSFVHENKEGKIPLELAIEGRHACSSNKLVFKILETTLLSGYACEVIFDNNMDSVVVFDCASEGISMFASFIRNSCDSSFHFHKTECEHCGRMIELESQQDCQKSVEKKKALVCGNYEDDIYRRIIAIRKNDRASYDYWMVESTLMEYIKSMKIMKKNRVRKQADLALQALIEGQTELAEMMASSMIEAEEKDKLHKTDVALRKKNAKQENKKKRMLKQLEEEKLKQDKETARLQTISEKKKADELLALKKSDDAEKSELMRLAKQHERNTKLKALLLAHREKEQKEALLIQTREKSQKETLILQPDAETDIANANECCVCLEKTRNTVLVPCHHLCLCELCAENLMQNTKASCPMCRAEVHKTIKIFL